MRLLHKIASARDKEYVQETPTLYRVVGLKYMVSTEKNVLT